MEEAAQIECVCDADASGNAEETFAAIEIGVLAGVDDVEAGSPEHDCEAEEADWVIERAGDGDPGGAGGNAEAGAKDEMSERGKAFGVAVEEDDGEGDRAEHEAERVQQGAGEEEDGA